MASPCGLKATPRPSPVGVVAGFAYLAPRPPENQGYALTKGVVVWATAIELGEVVVIELDAADALEIVPETFSTCIVNV